MQLVLFHSKSVDAFIKHIYALLSLAIMSSRPSVSLYSYCLIRSTIFLTLDHLSYFIVVIAVVSKKYSPAFNKSTRAKPGVKARTSYLLVHLTHIPTPHFS